ncbi:MAG: isoamylase early set domain-containing protein [Acidobacteriota bacterium]
MLKKNYSKTGKSCRVTFKLPIEQLPSDERAAAESVAVLGEWNAWDADTHPMQRRKDGSFSTTISLDAGRDYRFRYLVDGQVWTNDVDADTYVPNRFGTRDGIVAL